MVYTGKKRKRKGDWSLSGPMANSDDQTGRNHLRPANPRLVQDVFDFCYKVPRYYTSKL